MTDRQTDRQTVVSALLIDMKAFLLTLTVLLAVIRVNNGKPTVLQLPRYPLVYVGDDITLNCKGAGEKTTWKFNDVELSNKKSLLGLMMVTPKNNGDYTCEKNGEKSEALTLTVLVLEPHAQLSLPIGGAVITKGEARILTLQVDEDLDKWKCFAFRNNVGYKLEVTKKNTNMGTVYAELQDTQRATFWCMKSQTKHRSNALTLKMTERLVMLEPPVAPVLRDETITLRCAVWGGAEVTQAKFYKNNISMITVKSDEYKIISATESNNGEYKCTATYKYSHIDSAAVIQSLDSDPQELKVIGGPPVAVLAENQGSLQCSCEQCKKIQIVCGKYEWYNTDNSGRRTKLQESKYEIHPTVGGTYICRASCQDGFSRFSNPYVYQTGPSNGVEGVVVAVTSALVLIVLGVLIIVALKWRRRRGVQSLGRGKDDKMKDKSGADYEQLALTDKAIYHTLGEAKDQVKEEGEGGYEALKKTEDKGVYHTLKAGEGTGEGGYEALKKTEDKGVYHTLKAGEGSGEESSQAQGQGGYEALKNVKAQVYQTLSSDGSGKPKEEAEGGYEQLPPKIGDPQDVKGDENPYEELKAGKVEKKESTLEKE